jgi:hypothetical protein
LVGVCTGRPTGLSTLRLGEGQCGGSEVRINVAATPSC